MKLFKMKPSAAVADSAEQAKQASLPALHQMPAALRIST